MDEQKILHEIAAGIYDDDAGAFLTAAREPAKQGDLAGLARVIGAYLAKNPHKARFVTTKVPALVLNHYFLDNQGMDVDEFLNWQAVEGGSDWGDELEAHATDPVRLPMLVTQVHEKVRANTDSR